MGELSRELSGPAPPTAALELVWTVAQQPALGLSPREPVARGPQVTQKELDLLLGIELGALFGQGARPLSASPEPPARSSSILPTP